MKFYSLIFIFIANFSTAQSNLDTLCFNKINVYRKSKSKSTLDWNNIAFKAANYHSVYLKDSTDVISHHETTYYNPSNRLTLFRGTYSSISENVLFVSLNFSNDQNIKQIEEEISTKVLELWIDLPGHNKILLSNSKLAGISCVFQKLSPGIEGFINYTVWSTLVVYNP